MIKLVLYTGFLGAGKTTLLQGALTAFHGVKTGVIVNEFGDVNIDAVLLRQDGIQMAELSNGSIFCACIKDKFVDSLIEMSRMNLEYLFIEASGLADPSNMGQILDGIRHKTGGAYDYLGSVCVIDGETFLDLYELLPAIETQLEFCGAVIINKSDLIKEDQLGQVLEKVNSVNPKAGSYVTSFCAVDIKGILEDLQSGDRWEPESRDSSNTAESRPSSFVVKGRQPAPFDKLEAFLADVKDDSFRIKGFAITDRGPVEVSGVGRHIRVEPWDGPLDRTELVVISAVGFKMMSTITRAINSHAKGILAI